MFDWWMFGESIDVMWFKHFWYHFKAAIQLNRSIIYSHSRQLRILILHAFLHNVSCWAYQLINDWNIQVDSEFGFLNVIQEVQASFCSIFSFCNGNSVSSQSVKSDVSDELHSGSVRKRYVMRKKTPGKLLKSVHAVEREFQVLFYLSFSTNIFY